MFQLLSLFTTKLLEDSYNLSWKQQSPATFLTTTPESGLASTDEGLHHILSAEHHLTTWIQLARGRHDTHTRTTFKQSEGSILINWHDLIKSFTVVECNVSCWSEVAWCTEEVGAQVIVPRRPRLVTTDWSTLTQERT